MFTAKNLPSPKIEEHHGIFVVRDDLLPGGTKARYLLDLFQSHDEVVYASPAYGGAQLALAYCAQLTGKRATIFVAKRKAPHAKTIEALRAGAKVYQVPFGRLNVVQARAKRYAADKHAYLLPFGADSQQAILAIAQAAALVAEQVGRLDEVWCAAGSGTLIRGLQLGLPAQRFNAVQVGRAPEIGKATLHKHRLSFEETTAAPTPFPSCRNYDAKAWEICLKHRRGKALFWNVAGNSPTNGSEMVEALLNAPR